MIFLDSTILVGALDRNDRFHPDGSAVLRAVRDGTLEPAVVTDFVLDETLTILKRKRIRASLAATQVRELAAAPRVEVVFVDGDLFLDALAVYESHGPLSFTDATTVAAMRRAGARVLYSHDTDFDTVRGVERRERP